jgi:hypothetical protein
MRGEYLHPKDSEHIEADGVWEQAEETTRPHHIHGGDQISGLRQHLP